MSFTVNSYKENYSDTTPLKMSTEKKTEAPAAILSAAEEAPDVVQQQLLVHGQGAAPPGMRIGSIQFGTNQVVGLGIIFILVFGILMGLFVEGHSEKCPGATSTDDSSVPSPWNKISAIVGWIYFAAWSVSFYPQFYLNWARKSVVGYSFDYQMMNIIGFTAYSIYNCAYFWDTDIKTEYCEKHNNKPNVVQVNDVFFALHALLFTILTFLQAAIYEKGSQKVHFISWILAGGSSFVAVLYAILIAAHVKGKIFDWVTYLIVLSSIKLGVTIVKYMPQVHLNWKRKTTIGFNIWNVLLDFTGGSLSVIQLLIDCATTGNWEGIAGDPVKFGLGFASMVFDVIFMTQHYFLYAHHNALIHRLTSQHNRIEDKQVSSLDASENASLVHNDSFGGSLA